MLHGVTINGTNTLTEYGLCLLSDLKVGAPEKKTNYVDIPGADGSLDMSNYPQGRPVYKNRNISFTLFKADTEANIEATRILLRQIYHGKQVQLILPNDTTRYFTGVMSIGDTSGFPACKIPVSVVAEPYKMNVDETIVVNTVVTSKTVTLTNACKPVVPTITTTAAITLAFGGSSVSIEAGSGIVVPSLILEAGNTEVTITGAATVTFNYREGTL